MRVLSLPLEFQHLLQFNSNLPSKNESVRFSRPLDPEHFLLSNRTLWVLPTKAALP